jgi:hypothetical protein
MALKHHGVLFPMVFGMALAWQCTFLIFGLVVNKMVKA